MEGESPLFRRWGQRGKAAIDKILRCKICHLSLQTSLSHRELPPRAPAHAERRFDSLYLGRVLSGEVLLFRAVQVCCTVRLRARLAGGTRNAPCVVPLRLKITCCSGLCLWWVEIYPPSSVAYAPASPRGEAFCKIPFALRNMINELNFEVLFPTYWVLYTRYSRLYLLCMHGVKKASTEGKPSCEIPFALRNMINELNFEVLFPTYWVLYTRYSRLYLLCMHGVKKASTEGKPSCEIPFALCNMINELNFEILFATYWGAVYSLFKVVFAMYARRKEGFPSGGSCRVSD